MSKLEQIVATYFSDLRDKRGIGAGTPERSYYPAVANLLDAIGDQIKPKVICLSDLANIGAGQPDFGLYTVGQVQKGQPRKGQIPERGVVEMKGLKTDAWLTSETKQVSKYWTSFGLVLVTNLRDFLILGKDKSGNPVKLESFQLALNEIEFWDLVSTPQKSSQKIGRAFAEYLKRALTQTVEITEPKDVAWFLSSYGRDALQRIEAAGDLPALASIRSSLEEALGVSFEKEKGEHFFRSTLIQTLFYGVFSAWVLWAKTLPRLSPSFDWKSAGWYLNVPFIATLFQQLASKAHLQPLGLIEIMDWTAATLNRVNADVFIAKFNDADAVQFFYEPFLEAFDPDLRKQLGVWYTPSEVVSYIVARTDKMLREELDIADGLASENVFVLDPCCGTGAFLAAVLEQIGKTLAKKGLGSLKGQMIKKAAINRIYGFEILPAPFVIAHLKAGLVLKSLGVTLEEQERAGVYLTNALTGWEPMVNKPLPFHELEEERRRADKIKQESPILVILGNPPYNGFAGMAIAEERSLTDAYRSTKKVRKPEGQGLNDLYVRFYRMAERRITEKAGRGIISFISNYSWLDGLSFTGMRERFLEAFDSIFIDCLNGDKFRTGKTTPEGLPDPSIFSSEHNREGIQVGTAIATLVRKQNHQPTKAVAFRNLWGADKKELLIATAEVNTKKIYESVLPRLESGLPFTKNSVGSSYYEWPKFPELLPKSFAGIKTSRDEFLVGVDKETLEKRLAIYFDQSASDEEVKKILPASMTSNKRFDAKDARGTLTARGVLKQNIVRYLYRPFDVRYLYWEPSTKLLDEKRADYFDAYTSETPTIITPKAQRKNWSPPLVARCLVDLNAMDGGALASPLLIRDLLGEGGLSVNISESIAQKSAQFDTHYQGSLGFHCLAVLHSPKYCEENSGAMRADQPRVPIMQGGQTFENSVELGKRLSALLDPEVSCEGVGVGQLRSAMLVIGTPLKMDGKEIKIDDLGVTAGWGHIQVSSKTGSILVMPGSGSIEVRDYTAAERVAFREEAKTLKLSEEKFFDLLGNRTFDIYLNEKIAWTNVPQLVWEYSLGGYQVIKKWLSYREYKILGRALNPDEVAYVSEMIRRIAAILLMGPALDANYAIAKASSLKWDKKTEPNL